MLLFAAAIIAGATLWFASDISRRVRNEERTKVRVWAKAITQRSKLDSPKRSRTRFSC